VDKKRGKTVTKEAVEIRQRLALDQHRREQDPIEQNRLRLKKLREAGFLTPTRTKLSSEHLCVKKKPRPLALGIKLRRGGAVTGTGPSTPCRFSERI